MHWTVVIYLFVTGTVGNASIVLPGFWTEQECHAIITRMNSSHIPTQVELKTTGLKNTVLFNGAHCVPGEFAE
jgi:hypothetical protein